MIVWRGLGILVLIVPIAWWLAVVIALAVWGYYEPDSAKATATVYRTFAAGFALGALTLWPVTRHRERVATGVDHLAFIPMKFWPPLIAIVAIVAFVASFIPAALDIF